MRIIAAIVMSVVLSIVYAWFAAAEEQVQPGSLASAESSPASGDELHFVNVLTFEGEIVAINPARRLVRLKGPQGKILTLQAESHEDLATHKVGERVLVRYFEGAQIAKEEPGAATAAQSLKDGMLAVDSGEQSGKQHLLAASVDHVDAANQEVTLKGPDGSLKTIMVSNPDYLTELKADDRVVITRPAGAGPLISTRRLIETCDSR